MRVGRQLLFLLALMCCVCGSPAGEIDARSGATPVYSGDTVPTVRYRSIKKYHSGVDGKHALFVDARFEFDGEKIPGALFLNSKSSGEDVKRLLPNKKQLIVVYCANRTCPAGYWMARRLIEMGYERVYEYPGGIDDWREQGGTTEPAIVTSGSECRGEICAPPSARPNILFIITDDQDFATIGAYGGRVLTPNIDRLATEGMRFNRGYCTTSSCAPSRYSIMTGRLASRCSSDEFKGVNPPGTQAYITNDAIVLEPDRPTLPQVLRAGGYRTGITGKWHLGPHHYQTIGMQKVACERKLGDPEVDAVLQENQRKIAAYFNTLGFDYTANVYWDNVGEWATYIDGFNAQNMEWTVDGALKFLDQQDDRPFFFWFAPLQMHNPCAAVKEYAPLVGSERITPAGLLKTIPRVQPPRSTILKRLESAGIPLAIPKSEACVKYGTEYALWLDDGVGAVLKKLDQMGVADNTLVIFFSDNATWGKFHTYERGCNVPLIMRWPGKIKAGTVSDALVANVDFAPTVLAAAGLDMPNDLGTDGVNQMPLLTGEKRSVRKTVMLEFGTSRSVSDGKWKYIAIRHTDRDREFEKETGLPAGHWGAGETAPRFKGLQRWRKWHEEHYPAYYDTDQLYDLEKDHEEKTNLAANPEYADELARMKRLLSENLPKNGRLFGEFK